MPTDKLTLSVDSQAVAKGKRYAAASGRSLSSLVGDYLNSLDEVRSLGGLPPLIQELIGMGVGAGDAHADEKDDYRRHLEEKYL
ncbi:DUF6364 family protein [Bifidobacterium vespertilionis]|uniref:Toxin-antitoxin system protein n=1 Tax=Bifidobacterium vespertilionis TaxID=2562524 RepID=A0A5J5E349_9BIFI|nr:DUF6364 family protein [Bifidobacterium vespertilionis]KAA8819598.1 toxin-antitoxin system protein [Bifidobacterium vespertilionis]KAA8823394.1 toxin-antitoxin system protein [Bifidobacterium vespertilionis]